MFIRVKPDLQTLQLMVNEEVVKDYAISTAKNGLGEQINSEKTPRGWHEIVEKIGAGQPINTVFVGRKSTGEIHTPDLGKEFPARDWILTRILWLAGLEAGKNLNGEVDTKQRYIYIHGVPDENIMGVPQSRGCIQMHNTDLLELFDLVSVGAKIFIES